MKVLTIREPFATLIIEGYKTYEFRSWKTNYRGKILIHAAQTLEKKVVSEFTKYNLDYKCGYIIGEATITDCILVDDRFSEILKEINPIVYDIGNNNGNYAWKLENIKKYDEPIKIKGKLGLWNYNLDD